MAKYHFRNSSFISAVSVALVLCLIGAECVLLLTAGALVTRTREKVTVTAFLTHDADSTQCAELEAMLKQEGGRFTTYSLISAEQALENHINWLGEDPTEFLGYNPLTASYEIRMTETNTHPDSLSVIKAELLGLPYVDEVVYSREVADSVTNNMGRFMIILLIVALVLLVISIVLIVNTIHLQIYARRFLINTMTLVGATSWMIRRPFVVRNMIMGFAASVVALFVLGGVVFMINERYDHVLQFLYSWGNIAFVSCIVISSGLLITLLASLIATNQYIRMDNNTLYEI